MLDNMVSKSNGFIMGNGLDKVVKVLAIVGAYTAGKTVIKGTRQVVSMFKSDAKEAN